MDFLHFSRAKKRKTTDLACNSATRTSNIIAIPRSARTMSSIRSIECAKNCDFPIFTM